jgi:23S rRNA pseudouridine2605 synthase
VSVRLNKLLAQRGVGARRKCDQLIQQGAVRVNGRVVREPGEQVEPERDRISVDGRPLAAAAAPRYYVLNKPVGVITTLEDPEGRRTIRDLMPPGPRLFPVGRLDADTSGLLILTNDGELAHRLMHPRYGVYKTYRVRLDRAPGESALRRLQEGVEFEPGVRSSPARVRVLSDVEGDALLQVELHEGRYRQVRRMCEAVGLAVRALHRSAYGPLRLGPVQRGIWRELSDEEVRRLRAASARPRPRPRAGYVNPRAMGDAPGRLARRLGSLGVGEERHERPSSPAREERSFSPARRERSSGPAREERPYPSARKERPSSPRRGERSFASERGERPHSPVRRERPSGPAREERSFPPARRERPSGPRRGERSFASERGERPHAPARRERSSGPAREERSFPPARRERRPMPAAAGRSFRGAQSPRGPERRERPSRGPERRERSPRGPDRRERSFAGERPRQRRDAPRSRAANSAGPTRGPIARRGGESSRRSGPGTGRRPGAARQGRSGRGPGQGPRRAGRGDATGRGPARRGRR